jgi:hypothetical protein
LGIEAQKPYLIIARITQVNEKDKKTQRSADNNPKMSKSIFIESFKRGIFA